MGKSCILAPHLIAELRYVGVTEARVTFYGMKTPLQHLPVMFASSEHTVYFDLATTARTRSNDIILVRPAPGAAGMTCHVLMQPIREGYGGVSGNLNLAHFGRVKFKLYPKAVHIYKAASHLLPKFMSKREDRRPLARTLNANLDAIGKNVTLLKGATAEELGGLRMEMTLQATSLESAVDRISKSALLNLHEWISGGEGPLATRQLEATYVPRLEFLAFAEHVADLALTFRAQAESSRRGRSAVARASDAVGVMDAYAAIMWKPSNSTPTVPLPDDHWLRDTRQEARARSQSKLITLLAHGHARDLLPACRDAQCSGIDSAFDAAALVEKLQRYRIKWKCLRTGCQGFLIPTQSVGIAQCSSGHQLNDLTLTTFQFYVVSGYRLASLAWPPGEVPISIPDTVVSVAAAAKIDRIRLVRNRPGYQFTSTAWRKRLQRIKNNSHLMVCYIRQGDGWIHSQGHRTATTVAQWILDEFGDKWRQMVQVKDGKQLVPID